MARDIEKRLQIGIEEKPGYFISPDLAFNDESGNRLVLKNLINKPTIASLVYLSCTHICPSFLGGLAEAVGTLGLTPGKDFNLITVSLDDRDTPEIAGEQKKNYMKAIGRPLTENSWRFLTGDADSIGRFAEAVGLPVIKEDNGLSQPRILIFFSPGGRIVRYLYGSSFFPSDIRLALAEASRDEKTFGEGKLLLFSYGYDACEKKYIFKLRKVLGIILLFSLASLGFFVMLTQKNYEERNL